MQQKIWKIIIVSIVLVTVYAVCLLFFTSIAAAVFLNGWRRNKFTHILQIHVFFAHIMSIVYIFCIFHFRFLFLRWRWHGSLTRFNFLRYILFRTHTHAYHTYERFFLFSIVVLVVKRCFTNKMNFMNL